MVIQSTSTELNQAEADGDRDEITEEVKFDTKLSSCTACSYCGSIQAVCLIQKCNVESCMQQVCMHCCNLKGVIDEFRSDKHDGGTSIPVHPIIQQYGLPFSDEQSIGVWTAPVCSKRTQAILNIQHFAAAR